MKKTILTTVAAVALSAGAAHASLIGNTSGPDDSFSINFSFENTGADLLSLSIDGSTADAGNIIWDSIGIPGGTATLSSSAGENTNVMSFAFTLGNFIAGDTFTLSNIDPDFSPGAASVRIGELAGVTVSASFADKSTFLGTFVDDPTVRAGLILRETGVIPLPAGLPLMLAGLGALGIASRRRKAA